MIHVLRVFEAANEVQQFCQKNDWQFCFIGGIAIQRWGEPRMTQDADLTLFTGFGNEETFTDQLLSRFSGRRADARKFALANRVLLIQTESGVAVDVAFGAIPFEEHSIQRASSWTWSEEQSLITCSAEDLIVHKVFAGRDLDWGDVDRVLARQHENLNLALIRSELRPLLELKEDLGALDKLERMIGTVDRRLRAKP
jgi:hypothetical protein